MPSGPAASPTVVSVDTGSTGTLTAVEPVGVQTDGQDWAGQVSVGLDETTVRCSSRVLIAVRPAGKRLAVDICDRHPASTERIMLDCHAHTVEVTVEAGKARLDIDGSPARSVADTLTIRPALGRLTFLTIDE